MAKETTEGSTECLFVVYVCRWKTLPNLPTIRHITSALCVDDTSEAILTVGGYGATTGAPCCAELLIHTTGQSLVERWNWRKLSSMHAHRITQPGMMLMMPSSDHRQRVLVAGGESASAEILQLSCGDPIDLGQWTLISSLTGAFRPTFLVGHRFALN